MVVGIVGWDPFPLLVCVLPKWERSQPQDALFYSTNARPRPLLSVPFPGAPQDSHSGPGQLSGVVRTIALLSPLPQVSPPVSRAFLTVFRHVTSSRTAARVMQCGQLRLGGD